MVIGNQIGNPSSVGTKPGIQIGSSNNTIIGNKFDNTNGSVHYTYFIAESGGPVSNNTIMGNNLVVGTTGFINLNATSTDLVSKNSGYNPVGQVTAPAFPATTVAATNNTGADVTAYIANGTSAITVVQAAGICRSRVTTHSQISPHA